ITTRDGRRMSAARAFLRPAMRRPILPVLPNALATRVLLDGRRATAVEWERTGRIERGTARWEIVLCCGSVGSPQLLQLSGVGPAPLLQRLGVPVVLANSSVGANLQDHIGLNYTWRARVPTLNQLLRPWWGKLLAGSQYL